MSPPLNLCFPDPDHVSVRLGDEETGPLPFHNPLIPKDHQDLRWYVETYGAHSLGDPDDSEAARIKAKLPALGKALFQAVFQNPEAQDLYAAFLKASPSNRLLALDSGEPAILALPWELLHDPQAPAGTHLFHQHINLRRRLDKPSTHLPAAIPIDNGALSPLALRERAGVRANSVIHGKPRLHCLFVISRPAGQGFINPRADALAVLDALAQMPSRVTTEFLYPPDLEVLARRLQDIGKPAVDILHFDGHGGFDGNTGYLLFENYGQPYPVSGQFLGGKLQAHPPALVILSACQSATQGEEPLGSVAAALLAQGIPAVLAMTHKVLVKTTEAFFGAFYQALGEGQPLGQALNHARDHLDKHPEKAKVRRGQDWVPLQLHDWFVPSLYQNGEDLPLLEPQTDSVLKTESVLPPKSNLPEPPKAGFHGRTYELWRIERGFALKTRRITLTGFGGQGKTALAQEAGRWLLRTGQFQAAAFVTYAGLQTLDTVAIALNTLGEVLGESFPKPAAALEALRKTPTLIILDNLETLPAEALKELLDSAVEWSQTGATRVLLTTRSPDFQHSAYPVAERLDYLRVSLQGLGSREYPNDALEWFGELMKRPPEFAIGLSAPTREELVGLFDKVGFHPLSIHILAVQLKTRRVEELGERLEQLLEVDRRGLEDRVGLTDSSEGALDEDIPRGLAASLQLSLDRLEPEARALLPRLGVFQGGAWEPILLDVTCLDAQYWAVLRQTLDNAALIEAENMPGVIVPFLRFHPTLAPMLWLELNTNEQAQLSDAHLIRYYNLADGLSIEDQLNPIEARAVIRRELPNLLHAAHTAFQLDRPDATSFANIVIVFLNLLGLRLEQSELMCLVKLQKSNSGSKAWFLSQTNQSELLLRSGRVSEAIQLLQTILGQLGDVASYQQAIALTKMGICFRMGGLPDQAINWHRQALAVLDKLEPSDSVKWHRSICLTNLADALMELGQYSQARQEYQASLLLGQELNYLRGQGVVFGQLGTLAMLEGHFDKAIQHHDKALQLFKELQEPEHEAIAWHQLGRVYEEAREWDEAENCYRNAAGIREALGDKSGAAMTWNQLGTVNMYAGKLEAAEDWYQKAIDVRRDDNDQFKLALNLVNLAILLRTQPNRLAKAREFAEEALAIQQTLEPGATEIWKTYALLNEIAELDAKTAIH